MSEIRDVIDELRNYDSEREWFEFKENWFKADELGEYISALSNSAAMDGKKMLILFGESMTIHMRLQAPILTVIKM